MKENMENKMIIPKPKANKGEKVLVLNYRIKNRIAWEEGTVTSLRYENNFGGWYWTYDVVLNRPSKSGNRVTLYVGNKKIRRKL